MHSYLIKNSISKFAKLDPNLMSFEELKLEFENLLKKVKYKFLPVTLPKGAKLHRIRINNKNIDFTNLSELWCPPMEKLKLGRCNNLNEQILYMSGGGHTALNELSPNENDIVTCLECELLEDIKVVNIGVVERLQREKYFQQWKKVDEAVKKYTFKQDLKSKRQNHLLENFVIDEFTKEVKDENLYLYKKSAAISSFFLSAPTVQGIIYPSMKSEKKEMNYAFPVIEANRILKPIRIDVFRMGYYSRFQKMGFQLLKGSYSDLSFDKRIEYTDNYRPIENWAHK